MKCLLLGENLVSKPPLQAQEAGQGEGHDGDLQPLQQPAEGGGAGAGQGRQALLLVRGGPESAGAEHEPQPPPREVGVHSPREHHRGGGQRVDWSTPRLVPVLTSPHAHGIRG